MGGQGGGGRHRDQGCEAGGGKGCSAFACCFLPDRVCQWCKTLDRASARGSSGKPGMHAQKQPCRRMVSSRIDSWLAGDPPCPWRRGAPGSESPHPEGPGAAKQASRPACKTASLRPVRQLLPSSGWQASWQGCRRRGQCVSKRPSLWITADLLGAPFKVKLQGQAERQRTAVCESRNREPLTVVQAAQPTQLRL